MRRYLRHRWLLARARRAVYEAAYANDPLAFALAVRRYVHIEADR